MNTEHLYILDILYSYHVSSLGKIIYLCWIPSHICIHGDNETDKAAKSALEFWYVKFKISSTDLKQLFKLKIKISMIYLLSKCTHDFLRLSESLISLLGLSVHNSWVFVAFSWFTCVNQINVALRTIQRQKNLYWIECMTNNISLMIRDNYRG